MARKRYRRRQSALADLLNAPWPVSAVLAVVVYAGLKWALPAYGAGNMFLQPLALALSSFAELAGGALLLISLLAYIRAVIIAKKAAEATAPAPRPASGPVHPRVFHPKHEPSLHNPADDDDSPVISATALEPQAADVRPTAWSIELIRDLEWKRFEDVCQRFCIDPVKPCSGVNLERKDT